MKDKYLHYFIFAVSLFLFLAIIQFNRHCYGQSAKLVCYTKQEALKILQKIEAGKDCSDALVLHKGKVGLLEDKCVKLELNIKNMDELYKSLEKTNQANEKLIKVVKKEAEKESSKKFWYGFGAGAGVGAAAVIAVVLAVIFGSK